MSDQRAPRCEAPTSRCERRAGHGGEHGNRSMSEVMDDARGIERSYSPDQEARGQDVTRFIARTAALGAADEVLRQGSPALIFDTGFDAGVAFVERPDDGAIELAAKAIYAEQPSYANGGQGSPVWTPLAWEDLPSAYQSLCRAQARAALAAARLPERPEARMNLTPAEWERVEDAVKEWIGMFGTVPIAPADLRLFDKLEANRLAAPTSTDGREHR